MSYKFKGHSKSPLAGNGGGLPLVHRLFSSRRLGEWKNDASVLVCAEDLAAFLTAKGWVVVNERRRRFIRSVPFWEQFHDSFCFSSDGRKLVMRTDWNTTFVVEIAPGATRWSVRPSSKDECIKFEGMGLYLAELHAEYFDSFPNRVDRSKSESKYVAEWMSIGKDVDKGWIPWMRVCASPKEAIAWAELGFGPETICRWLAIGVGVSGAREWLAVGGNIGDAEDWIEAGWTSRGALRRIRQHGF